MKTPQDAPNPQSWRHDKPAIWMREGEWRCQFYESCTVYSFGKTIDAAYMHAKDYHERHPLARLS